MTPIDPEELSRILALRPASRPGTSYEAVRPRNWDHLAGLLAAECPESDLGSHLAVRRWSAEPRPAAVGPRAMHLLAPGMESVADSHEWLFLDTETTGLAGGTGTYAFLVGLAWWEDGGLAIEQLFMRDHGEERSMLAALTARLAQRSVLVTFNGKSFDWPLLETRYRMSRMNLENRPPVHLDLLHPARQLWRLRLRSVALAELEAHVLACGRAHDIPSETIPRRYFEFLRGGPAAPVAEVFHHNELDLKGLAKLAVRITSMLEEPESQPCGGPELFGISRLLMRRGQALAAGRLFERALESGLPARADRSARRELARFAKRSGDHERANKFWQDLLGDSADGLEAYEQLAIFYEHRAGDPDGAADLTRRALMALREAVHAGRMDAQRYRYWHARLQHRLARLTR